ncbi:hypothetical protein C1I98_06590 [Spongiactinospora gelatinilytica]|uniref:N-acetylneuraminate lyase n=1 Tax=Spongiactinospora gelatinilytica TaxID=2666298 RepID=A0A2W2IT23_9ACTN|nr:dihydrodipicolinate synthase family protein [Spongiactinospora gelatinilytica]PZG52934.1 hypothetical protein C1I98_06590 [Spongiactinospora gelatinilytica]
MHHPPSAGLEIWAATPTPFGPDGELRPDVVAEQARHLTAAGVSGAFVGGTTGEFAALSTGERLELVAAWAAYRPPGLRLCVHVGHTALGEATALARQAGEQGADMIAAVAPYYGSPSGAEAVVDHLAEIAAAAPGVPFCYYHAPEMSGLRVPASAVAAVAAKRIPAFGAVKFTDGDLLEFARTQEVSPHVRVYFGRDELLPAAFGMGGHAVIGSLYNFLAPAAREVYAAATSGRLDDAVRLHRPFREVADVADRHGTLPVVKELAALLGGPDTGRCRSPWHRLTGPALTDVRRLADRLATPG